MINSQPELMSLEEKILRPAYSVCEAAALVMKHGVPALIDYWLLGKSRIETYKHASEFFDEALEIFDIDVQLSQENNLVPGPAIICPNHISNLDIPALSALNRRIYFGAKKELAYIPILGMSIASLGMPFIDKKNHEGAVSSLDTAVEMIKAESLGRKDKDTVYLVIFPEGTRGRSDDYVLGPFRKGAFALSLKSGVPIVPVSIYGGRELLPRGALSPKPGRIIVTVSSPIYPEYYISPSMDEDMKHDAMESMISDTRSKIMLGLEMQKRSFYKLSQ